MMSLQPLDDSSDLLKSGNFVELRKHLERDGLLFLPGTIAPEKVMAARSAVLKGMADAGGILDPSADWNEAKLNKDCSIGCVPFMEGGDQLPSVIDVAECDELRICELGVRISRLWMDVQSARAYISLCARCLRLQCFLGCLKRFL